MRFPYHSDSPIFQLATLLRVQINNVYVCNVYLPVIMMQLASTEEWIDSKFADNLGEVLIRCNNVLYLRGVEEEAEDARAEN